MLLTAGDIAIFGVNTAGEAITTADFTHTFNQTHRDEASATHNLSGASGSHVVQFLSARAQIPVFGRLGLGVDFVYGARDSFYRDYANVQQNGSQGRLFLTLF